MILTRILLAEDYDDTRARIGRALEHAGFDVLTARDGREALELIRTNRIDLVVSDFKMPGMDGLTLHEEIRCQRNGTPLVLYSSAAPSDVPFRAGRDGVLDFLDYPFDVESQLVPTIQRALSRTESAAGDPNLLKEDSLIGLSEELDQVRREIRLYGPSPATVLITGETGTGKELVARSVHDSSTRAEGPYVKVNCPALPRSLVESELFGHEKGSFTGAHLKKRGRFETASGGTIFLDEIGEIDMQTQAKLLQVVQDGNFARVGGGANIKADVRIVAATNRDLRTDATEGRFRQDLFYRLAQATIHVPPLRERPADLEPLAEFYVQKYAAATQRPIPRLSSCFVEAMKIQPWHGNVRELLATLQRALLWWDGEGSLDALCFVKAFSATDGKLTPEERAQCQQMLQAYSKANRNQERARRSLGMTRSEWRHRWENKFGLKVLGRRNP